MPRPADACPFPRPFPADFAACPAYQAVQAVGIDSNGRMLSTVWTCRHLTSRRFPRETGHFYGGCSLGDEAGRDRWIRQIGVARLQAIAQLRRQLLPMAQGLIDGMIAQRTQSHAKRDGRLEGELRRLGDRYLAELEQALSTNRELGDQAEMPKSAVMRLAREWVDRLVYEMLTAQAGEHLIPADLLEALPQSVRQFYT